MSYWRICLNGGMPCGKINVMGRNVIWRIYCKDGDHVSWVDMYFGSYYHIATLVFFVYVNIGCVCIPGVGLRCVSWNTVLYILEYLNNNKI